MGIVRFTLKSSVAGGLLYYTVQEGLWSKPEDTVQLYCKIYNAVTPYIQKNVSQDIVKIPELPSVSTLATCARGTYNKGVIASIKFIADIPTHASNGIDYLASLATTKESVAGVKGLFNEQSKTGKTQ